MKPKVRMKLRVVEKIKIYLHMKSAEVVLGKSTMKKAKKMKGRAQFKRMEILRTFKRHSWEQRLLWGWSPQLDLVLSSFSGSAISINSSNDEKESKVAYGQGDKATETQISVIKVRIVAQSREIPAVICV